MKSFIFIPEPMPPEEFYGADQMATSLFPARHLGDLAAEVKDRLGGGTPLVVYEIGCNDGHFLGLLDQAGLGVLGGIEPSEACAAQARSCGFAVETGFFTGAAAERLLARGPRPDLVVCRHVLEHVTDLDDFVLGISRLVIPEGLLLLEVPDLGTLGGRGDFSAIWEQHVNYFDLPVLRVLMARFGLRVQSARRMPHGGGTLLAFLAPGPTPGALPPAPDRDAARASMRANIEMVRRCFLDLRAEGRRVMAFGAGMRGTMLINLAGIGAGLSCVLDDNPDKVGRFLPGSRLPIRHPEALREDPPDFCLMLPLHDKEAELACMARFPEFLAGGGRFIECLADDGRFLAPRSAP